MKFKELTDEIIEKARQIYTDKNISWDNRMLQLTDLFGRSERTVRKWCSEKLGFKEKAEVEPEQYTQAKSREFDKEKKRFIITWAQNNTPVHTKFLKNIEKYAEFIEADIHVIAGRYKNPTSVWTNQQENEEFWDDRVVKYLDANRHDIHKYVSILSDIKIPPTAVNPMTGMQALSGVNSCVFGSPKVQMEMIPVLDGNAPKMMLTTGAITMQNYTDSKSGKVGEFHHTFGFVIVEIKDDEIFFVRQVTADDNNGNFSDLCYRVENGSIKPIKSLEAIILGDLHCGHHDDKVLDTTIDMMNKMLPKHVILHDVFDGDSISHHQMKDPFVQYGKEVQGTNDLGKEIDNMMGVLDNFKHFDNVRQHATGGEVIGVIPELIKDRFPKFITLGRSASYRVKDWELGQHGDIGSNGSRGSLLQFRKLNTKIVVGHYHSPGRKDGALAVGTSTKLRVGYNNGPSTWLQSHVIIHTDGRAQHINFINGEYTTLG